VKRLAGVTSDRAYQLIQVTMRYVEESKEKAPIETIVKFCMRWFWRYELEHPLCRAGFEHVNIYGDFNRSPVRWDSPAFVVLAS